MEQYFTMNILVNNSLTETQCSEALQTISYLILVFYLVLSNLVYSGK